MEIPWGWFFLNDLVWKNLPEIIGFGPGPAVGLGIGDICCRKLITQPVHSCIFLYIYIYYYENHHGLSPKK